MKELSMIWIVLLFLKEIETIFKIIYINDYTKNGYEYSVLFYISNICTLTYDCYNLIILEVLAFGYCSYNDAVYIFNNNLVI